MKGDPPLVETVFKALSVLQQFNETYTSYSFKLYPKLFDIALNLISDHPKELQSLEAAHFLSEAIKNLSAKNFESLLQKKLIDILGKSLNIDFSPTFIEYILTCIYNCYITGCKEKFRDSENVKEEKFLQQFECYKLEEFLKMLIKNTDHPCSELAASMLDIFEDNPYEDDDDD